MSFREIWQEGRRQGFPPCCRARFLLDAALPLPPLLLRLRQLMPRRAIADGCVPCEGHVLLWLLEDDKRRWRARKKSAPMCCERRRDLEALGAARLELQKAAEDEEGQFIKARIWLLFLGEEGINVKNCPWCGTALEGG